jgi:leucyl/phenylalanyl-tRNA---protein transferase
VLFFDGFHVSKRVRAIMRQSKYTVTFDQDFESVIVSCAGRRRGRWHLTWITPRIMHAYARLYDEGHVHSFEVWNNDGVLVGGGYGVAIGRAFIIESQFFREPNASKIGFAVLAWHLAQWGFVLCDNKWLTPTTEQMGFVTLPRQEFLKRLAAAVEGPGKRDCWKPEAGPETVANWRPEAAAAA